MKGDVRPRLLVAAGIGVVAAGAARGAYTALRRCPPAGDNTWARTNFRGEPLTLLEGPAVTIGAVTGQVITAAVTARLTARPSAAGGHQPERARVITHPLAIAGLGGAAFGLLDDLRGSGKRRGLRGHLGALRHGEVTTGTIKLAGLAVTGLGAALLEGGDPADVAINAGLIAGGANLLNLFDLRPGRAIKVATLTAALIAAGDARAAGPQAVAAPVGAALALLPEDLGERAMLGDAGANALGAMLGAAAARTLPRTARACLLAGIVALTVVSEKVSFTKVIAATPPLNWLDMLGRRPPPLAAPVSAAAAAADSDPAPSRRRGPGRHRRVATTVSRFRSGTVFLALASARSGLCFPARLRALGTPVLPSSLSRSFLAPSLLSPGQGRALWLAGRSFLRRSVARSSLPPSSVQDRGARFGSRSEVRREP